MAKPRGPVVSGQKATKDPVSFARLTYHHCLSPHSARARAQVPAPRGWLRPNSELGTCDRDLVKLGPLLVCIPVPNFLNFGNLLSKCHDPEKGSQGRTSKGNAPQIQVVSRVSS